MCDASHFSPTVRPWKTFGTRGASSLSEFADLGGDTDLEAHSPQALESMLRLISIIVMLHAASGLKVSSAPVSRRAAVTSGLAALALVPSASLAAGNSGN